MPTKDSQRPKTQLVRESETLPLSELTPASVNDKIYKPVSQDDPATIELAKSIQKHGLKEDIVVTLDNVILSGHRRRAACLRIGIDYVQVRREPIHSTDPTFVELLVSYNTQRVKSFDEQFNEALITASKKEAYQSLIA